MGGYVGNPADATAQLYDERYVRIGQSGIGWMTPKNATGTAVDFTGIPAGVKRITVMFSLISNSGTSQMAIQLGNSGGFETSGYLSVARWGANIESSGAGFILGPTGETIGSTYGQFILSLVDSSSNTWVMNGGTGTSNSNYFGCAGNKSLSAALDRLRVTSVNGTDTFTAGIINVMYEL